MGNISKPFTFAPNTTILSSQANADFDAIYNEFNGNIDASNLADNAIVTAKLADSAVTTAKIADDAVTAAKTAFGGDYTTSEVNTGFKWVDNKDIYKKTISIGAMPNNASKTVAHSIATIDKVIAIEGFMNFSGAHYPLPTVDPGTLGNAVRVIADATNVGVYTTANYAAGTGYVTLLYTKV